ncbi:MAG: type II toxin-antitoxin system VapC family toxin [Thermomicrobiales bacterium]
MKYLLDTNVVSELMKAHPEPVVANWVLRIDEMEVAVSVVAFMEIRQGIELMPRGRRRQRLETWLVDEAPKRFAGRVLGIDHQTAEVCGTMLATNRLNANVRRILDIWLAAIAVQHGLTLVTRNQKDFQRLGVKLINPWTEEATS